MKYKKIYLILVGCLGVILLAASYSYADGAFLGAGGSTYVISAALGDGAEELVRTRQDLLASVGRIPVIEVGELPEELTSEAFERLVATQEFQNIADTVDANVLGPFYLGDIGVFDPE